ncbi:MAG: hypothetical protein HDS53_07295 [Barnesiella sp.]|nr:hypothetical protein [Barnesiella sp.]
MESLNNYPTDMLDTLKAIRPGTLTIVVPTDSCIEKIRHRVAEIAMSMGIRYEWSVVKSNCPSLHWNILTRRVSALDPSRLSFVGVKLQDIDHPKHVARFFRSKLFGVLDTPDKLIEYYKPDLSDYNYKPSTIVRKRELPTSTDSPLIRDPECSLSDETSSLSLHSSFFPSEQDDEFQLESEKKRWVDALSALMVGYVARFHETPPIELIANEIRGKITLSSTKESPITVNGDMKIFLPELNEIQLRMTPLATTVYILFLCHPEGIRLKDIADYRSELIEIYSMVKPGGNDTYAEQSINELVNPLSNSLQEKLSMTRRAVKRYILDPKMAELYMISGQRNGLYRIAIDPALIHLPDSLKR